MWWCTVVDVCVSLRKVTGLFPSVLPPSVSSGVSLLSSSCLSLVSHSVSVCDCTAPLWPNCRSNVLRTVHTAQVSQKVKQVKASLFILIKRWRPDNRREQFRESWRDYCYSCVPTSLLQLLDLCPRYYRVSTCIFEREWNRRPLGWKKQLILQSVGQQTRYNKKTCEGLLVCGQGREKGPYQALVEFPLGQEMDFLCFLFSPPLRPREGSIKNRERRKKKNKNEAGTQV